MKKKTERQHLMNKKRMERRRGKINKIKPRFKKKINTKKILASKSSYNHYLISTKVFRVAVSKSAMNET